MSIHKLSAGSGYTYLTRQVAVQDRVERGNAGLASYYTGRGEMPGQWVGSGMVGIEGLSSDDAVTGEHMVNLYGHGRHPLADQLRAAAVASGVDRREAEKSTRLGTPYLVFDDDIPTFRQRVAQRMAEVNEATGLDRDAPGDPAVRARVRTEVGVELFREEFGRDPVDEREVMGSIARHSRPRTTAVAGFDLTFSPVKSVSTLWAIADPRVSAAIERAHDQAVRDALAFLERAALFTREGHKGVRQVETRGLIGAAFTHRDSRAGDPDLHTHVAIANKVQTKDSGKWLSIDGRLLYKANVAASETYNTALEHHLRRELGLRFEARPSTDRRKREIREIVGVDARLNERWSSRRASITTRQGELTRRFHTDHGRPPTSIEAIALAQQATLETRQAKHEPRTVAEQRTQWAGEAAEVLGGQRAVAAMTATALRQAWRITPTVDEAWMHATAVRIRDIVQSRRSHWQVWHVRAEALRQVRSVDLDTAMIDQVVDTLVTGVLTHHSVPLAGTVDALESVDLPAVLRRSDGSSVYTIAGSNLYTSQAILTAESRITARAGQHDGHRISTGAVDLALLESTANGLTLNAGQATLVKAMATSGARVQLAIAPAGAGKTTAIETLARAWTDNGGTLIALAPSAAAADVLATTITPADSDSTSKAATDTLAKLAWHITHPDDGGPVPHWVTGIGPDTLVVIDEAGMADTLTLDTVIEYAITAGASVRLIGDDQQLAAVGAGGVLRDIAAAHGAVHLSELMRFTKPAEAAASLALRDGHLEAIGFYLDNGRVHIGDQDTLLDDILSAWAADHASGRDAIMLAPTRDLVATLNARARTHRLAQASPAPVTADRRGGSVGSHPLTGTNTNGQQAGNVGREVRLADGNLASVGDLIITRSNDRRLRIAATDWVKNGDRWCITDITPTGAITAARIRGGRHITLPPAYVTASVDLGYATTIHTAQGVTADTSHTLLTGAASRQVAYTAATRGRTENHLYLSVVGDGDPHSVIRPEHTHPDTPTDLLEAILTRDDSARSATTIARDTTNPAALLGDAVARYLDTLSLAAEHHLGTDNLTRLDTAAEAILTGLTEAPAWPTLRNRLILTALDGHNPLSLLRQAYSSRLIDDTDDPAAILNWRLTHTATTNTHASGVGVAGTIADPVHSPTAGTPGPLPWLPGIPAALLDDPTWGTHVSGRAAAVRYLRTQITDDLAAHPDTEPPAWSTQGTARPSLELLTDITLFRAAHHIDDTDRRPTGPPQQSPAARDWQNHLTRQLAGTRTPALAEWRETFNRIFTHPRQDPFTPVLAERLSAISRAGINTPNLIHTALTTGAPLPDDHQAAALWWRLTAHLSPAVTTHATNPQPLTVAWHNDLDQHLDPDTTATLQASPWWPTLVTVINHALARGETLATILADIPDDAADLDPAQGLVWRVTLRNNPLPEHADTQNAIEPVDGHVASEDEANPFWQDPVPTAPTPGEYEQLPHDDTEPPDNTDIPDEEGALLDDEIDVDAVLTWAALTHQHRTILPPTDREIETALRQAIEADQSPVTPERIYQLNQAALDFYTDAFPGSWAQTYLTQRLRTDITGHPTIHPGYAPPGWTSLITHLRAHGATDQELTLSGLATTTRDGRLIDRFRDRLILPITHTTSTGTTETLGFVARANPHLHPTQSGPKYLNTPDTAAFHKSNQLYIAEPADPSSPARFPVLVEGPLDAIAVTIATKGRHIGYAPLGTALTETQARELARAATSERHQPILAFDNDDPGQHATRRAYWLLAQHGTHPHAAVLRAPDPADMLTLHGPDGLTKALQHAHPASDAMLAELVAHDPTSAEIKHAMCILATMPAPDWAGHLDSISTTTSISRAALERMLTQRLTDQAQHPRLAAYVDRGERKASMRPRSVVQRSLSPARPSAEISNHARHIPPMSP